MITSIFQKLVYTCAVVALLGLSACGLSQYNNSELSKLPDHNEGNEYVYGIEGDSARQLRNEYTDSPESLKRTIAIREMMFGDDKTSLESTTQLPGDSTQQEPAATATPDSTNTEAVTDGTRTE
ncbi:MAG: hypothetical protein ACFB0B_06385 [Thermonemataceae bacterium]